jgi:geranylgeranyl pyrophosphate synthase
MEKMREIINQRLEEIVDSYKNGNVKEAMKYSLLAGGKRIRPIMMLTLIKSYGKDYLKYLDIACAIEMIHTYSLIHDDLPGMDNDDLRRGRPTCHKQFDEATAILAGDALLNEAVNVIINVDINSELKLNIIKALYNASGINGMIYGQQQDLYFENKQASLEQLKDIHKYKTGALISVCFEIGSLIVCPKDVEKWKRIGYDLGLAFQIQDDVLDVIGNEEQLGKKIGSDETNHKSTYVSLLGIEESQKYIEELFEKCYANLYSFQINHGLLLDLFMKILKRVS